MVKKHFILLELLLALALVSFTILPFLHYPYEDVKRQLNSLFEIELQHEAQKELAKWETALYQGDKDLLERIFDKPSRGLYDTENSQVLVQVGHVKRHYNRKLYIYPTSTKKNKEGALLALVKIEVSYFSSKKTKTSSATAKRVIFCKMKM